MTSTEACGRFRDDLVGLIEGTAAEGLGEHVASCDRCRDAAHLIERVTARIARAGDDLAVAAPLAERLAGIASEAEASAMLGVDEAARVSQTRLRATEPPAATPGAAPKRSRRAIWLLLAACASITASAAVGVRLADRQRSPSAAATRAWHGKVGVVSRSGPSGAAGAGLSLLTTTGKTEIGEGAEVGAGMRIVTDGRTRARLALDDGSTLVLDRATEIAIDMDPRTVTIADGAILADVAHVEGAPSAMVKTPNGTVKVLGTKLAVTAAADRTNVEVLRGEVEIATSSDSHRVSAGQEGVVGKDGRVDVAPANDLAQRTAFGERLIATHNEDAEAPASGLGELRAKRPGRTDEKDRAVRLERHAVKVRIAGNVARTEIDETFANDTDDELEGIYRFPLPPGAQIERLALEVDGHLLDGEFVDRARASAIWRGAIQNAAPKAAKPREEIVWVPGPWHDPALLEWQRGGRFELRIFPIPKRGSRRVVIAYTETVAPVAGVRRYVYPLPQGSSSRITIDQFSVDAQVLGHDGKVPVRARGYELGRKTEAGAERLSTTMSAFVPSGDLAIEYGLDDRATDATAWAYKAEPPASSAAGKNAKKTKDADPVGNDPFVAIALRPKLPRWSESKPRDQVIVVDAGRTMYGERFARARRLAVQITQEMDRRDRVTVIACDVGCRVLPGGFVAPGAPGAHDVDAFLGGVTPDGASDLVGAVRAAATMSGRDPAARDLRVAVLSDGVATAGYRSASRVATEVSDAINDGRATVVAVPIGADADVALLSDIARGGGGVVVPYQPGQRLESTAFEVLNATYGTTLRDVQVVLPDGLRDAAPATVPPLRAGSETIVTARMTGDSVKGDVVVRGKVAGETFEAKYPIDIRATGDGGNAFVPRLFAAARIADREREPGDGGHAELVALSRRFAVPSRTTSLLVLESEAMFKAFGIDRAEHGPQWTGEALARGAAVATLVPGDLAGAADAAPAAGHRPIRSIDASDPWTADDEESGGPAKKEKGATLGGLSGAGRGGGGAGPKDLGGALSEPQAPSPRPAATAAAAPPPAAESKADLDRRAPAGRVAPPRVPPRGGRFMKKVFVRHATLHADAAPGASAAKIAAARAAVAAAPDERSKHKDLARMLAVSGQLDELNDTLEKWSVRDPLDADVIVGRSDVAARRGDRDGALRILGGALSASGLSVADAFAMAQALGRSYDRLARPEGCAFHVAAAELRGGDADAIARAVTCERAAGRTGAAERWLAPLKDGQRTAVSAALARLETTRNEGTFGDVVVNATWNGGGDLDVALIDPAGRRAGAVTRMKGAHVEGATARDHETVALSSGEGGSFLVEIVRANATEATSSVSGTVTIKAFGQSRSIPFTLTGARAAVGRADVRWEAELVPVEDDGFGAFQPTGLGVFDRGAAAGALARVDVQHCASSGQIGTGHVTVAFAPTGRVMEVLVDDANFSGTAAGRCVQTTFLNVVIPPFAGAPARVGKSFSLGGR